MNGAWTVPTPRVTFRRDLFVSFPSLLTRTDGWLRAAKQLTGAQKARIMVRRKRLLTLVFLGTLGEKTHLLRTVGRARWRGD
jgi:hypothetical protein